MSTQSVKKSRYDKLGPKVVQALNQRHFEAYYCDNAQEAIEKVLQLIPKEHVVAWGGSTTLNELNLKNIIKDNNYTVIDRDTAQSMEERVELMRQSLLCDTYLMSSNAITEDGILFNIDGNGNRLAAMIYGPKSVIIIAGMNKVVKDLEHAISHVRNVTSPLNTLNFPQAKTPCNQTGTCSNCISEDTSCAQLVTTRVSRPAKKHKVILIGEDFSF